MNTDPNTSRSSLHVHIASNLQRLDYTENSYKELERLHPCEPLTEEMLVRLNEGLGFSEPVKGQDYRPYCLRPGCVGPYRWPRMHRVPEGFCCGNCGGIWNLKETPEENMLSVTPRQPPVCATTATSTVKISGTTSDMCFCITNEPKLASWEDADVPRQRQSPHYVSPFSQRQKRKNARRLRAAGKR